MGQSSGVRCNAPRLARRLAAARPAATTTLVLLAEVAIPVPLAQAFTYAMPPDLARRVEPGMRVVCPFRKRHVQGVVIDIADREPPVDPSRIKPIARVLDDAPCVPPELLRFLREMASYYLAPIGEVVRLAIPALERSVARELADEGLLDLRKHRTVGGRRVRVVRATSAMDPGGLRGTLPQVLAHVRSVGEIAVAQLEQVFPTARSAVKRLEALGLVATDLREAAVDPVFGTPVARDDPPPPTDAQQTAIDAIVGRIRARSGGAFLLHGVTGSGKTEVYLRAIAACLDQGDGALVLVPEISLTPQLVARFRARFGDVLAVLHSGLSDRARHEMWRSLHQQRVRVAIGARSALFAPVARLGLVIVDEEHDPSFKQEEGVRYQARDMALLRAHRTGAVCVLGSATPSLESEALARSGRLQRLVLAERAIATATLPSVQLVDLRRTGPGPGGHPMLSLPLHRAIERALQAGGQVILFLNRRGFAPSVLCEACGQIAHCPHCSVSLTYHRAHGGRIRCHYCDYDVPMWTRCASCGHDHLTLAGAGTERLEEVLARSFPQARVARLDRDIAAGVESEAVIDRMRRHEADILVGTQLVTKGHDLPDVTLVGVINADAALSLPDFRAAERTFQLLVQVAGRAGRANQPGQVIVQTRLPDHAVLRFALRHDVQGFVEQELGNRRDALYPPFARLVLVRLDAPDDARVRAEADRIAAVARKAGPALRGRVDVLGPSPAPLERLRGRYRYRVLLRAADRPPLRVVAQAVVDAAAAGDRLVRVTVDVDPVHML